MERRLRAHSARGIFGITIPPELAGFTFISARGNVMTYLYPRQPQTLDMSINIGDKFFRIVGVPGDDGVIPYNCQLWINLVDNCENDTTWRVIPVEDSTLAAHVENVNERPMKVEGRGIERFKGTLGFVLAAFGEWLANSIDKITNIKFIPSRRIRQDYYIDSPYPDLKLNINKPHTYYVRENNIKWLGLKCVHPGVPIELAN